jgi:hypothetical protein
MRITEKENMMKEIIEGLKKAGIDVGPGEEYFEQEEYAEILNEGGMGPISSEGEKTIKVTHKTSGKTLVVVDTSASRKQYAKMGYTEAEEEIRVLDIDWGTAEIGGK